MGWRGGGVVEDHSSVHLKPKPSWTKFNGLEKIEISPVTCCYCLIVAAVIGMTRRDGIEDIDNDVDNVIVMITAETDNTDNVSHHHSE